MNETRDILVSGWRFILHSYAVANQFLCLELLRRAPGVPVICTAGGPTDDFVSAE